MRFLPLERVRVTAGAFADAIDTDLRYTLSLDPDRLLAPFRREAGLPALANPYGNWEDSGLDGHTAGHYLSALAFLGAATGNAEARRRLNETITALAECQGADGYLGGVPGGRTLFSSLAETGRNAVAELASSTHWVPWYNLHKTFQGLLDAHLVGGNTLARTLVERLADWWLPIAGALDEEGFEAMLAIEYGGMNTVFAQLSQLTGRAEYARQAERFSHQVILDPLLHGEDPLTGLHANTQIPKAVGYAATALATGDDRYLQAAEAFWRIVVDQRTVAIGGNSVREHFHPVDDFSPMIDDREGPEFCNTYNMIVLTRALAERELHPEHLDFAERALFNQVLASQHPGDGGFVYFTSLRPRHYRVYSQAQECFWCCVGTGMEAQARYGEWVFGIEGESLAVNLYTNAEAEVPEFGGRIRVEATLPASALVSVTLDLDDRHRFPLRLRVPHWAAALIDVQVNGAAVSGTETPGALVIERDWDPGDTVTFSLPLELRTEQLPDGSPWQAYLVGPSVLAHPDGTERLDGLLADGSRMGHVAHGPLLPLAEVPIMPPDVPVGSGAGGEWTVPAGSGETVRLRPFAELHDTRYTLYFPTAENDTVDERRAELHRRDQALALDEETIDAVALGEQQPESDHGFRSARSEVILTGASRWRRSDEGFSVRLNAVNGQRLRVRYLTAEEATALALEIDGTRIAVERFAAGPGVLERDYPLAELLAERNHPERIQVSFLAGGETHTPGIGLVRLLR